MSPKKPSSIKSFGQTAKALSGNPLGIIALFIVLVYGIAAFVTASATVLSKDERTPLIWFMVVFPVLVLIVFSWLVSKHSGQLYAPSDYRDEDNYIRMQMTAVASLTAASTKSETKSTNTDIQKIVDAVRQAIPLDYQESGSWRNHVLWVDDIPENNSYERRAFETTGLRFTLALSTSEALSFLSKNRYAAIISDMKRKEGSREGYVLLDEIRRKGDQTPFFIYSGAGASEYLSETVKHSGQGTTSDPQDLFKMVMKAIVTRT